MSARIVSSHGGSHTAKRPRVQGLQTGAAILGGFLPAAAIMRMESRKRGIYASRRMLVPN
jgi:hypothetical protein